MTESEMYKKHLKPLLLKKGYMFERIESQHLPDIFCIKNGKVLWIEMKIAKSYKKYIAPSWRNGQLAWIWMYQNKGGKVLLSLGYDDKMYILKPYEVYRIEDLKNEVEL